MTKLISIFKRKERNYNVGVTIHLIGEKMELSVPVTTTSKSLAKKIATDLVQRKIIVVPNSCRKVFNKQ